MSLDAQLRAQIRKARDQDARTRARLAVRELSLAVEQEPEPKLPRRMCPYCGKQIRSGMETCSDHDDCPALDTGFTFAAELKDTVEAERSNWGRPRKRKKAHA